MNFKIGKIYFWAIGFAGLAYIINLFSLGEGLLKINIISGNLLFWNTLIFVLTYSAMTSYFLYESSLLRTILPLPLRNDFIYNLFLKQKFTKGLMIIVFSGVSAFALGVPEECPILALMAFAFSTVFLYFLSQLVTLMTLKKPVFMIKIRAISLLFSGILFFTSTCMINSASGLVFAENIYLLAKYVINLSLDTFIYVLLPVFFGLYYTGKILEEILKSTAKKHLTRELLISTAFPLTGKEKKQKGISLIEKILTFLPYAREEKKELSLINHFPDLPIIRRYLFIFQETFGYNNRKNLLTGIIITFCIGFPAAFLLTSETTAGWLLTPLCCMIIFTLTGYILNPSAYKLKKFGIAVNTREFSFANAVTIGSFFTLTGVLTVCLTLLFMQGIKFRFTAGALFGNLIQFILIVLSFVFIFSHVPSMYAKKSLKSILINLMNFIVIYFFLILYQISFMSSSFQSRFEKNNLVDHNIIAKGISWLLTPVCYLLYEKEYEFLPESNKMQFLEKIHEISKTIPHEYLVLPGWLMIISIFCISFYFVYRYGKNIIPAKYQRDNLKINLKLFNH